MNITEFYCEFVRHGSYNVRINNQPPQEISIAGMVWSNIDRLTDIYEWDHNPLSVEPDSSYFEKYTSHF